jgi:S1 RNA binding domain
MESEAFFQEKVYLTPKDLRNEIGSVDTILINKLKERLEQRCSPHGYVLPGTLELLTRSAGMVDSGRFSGDWAFLVKAKGSVLHPPEGTMVEVEILKNNKMGIYAEYENAIRIMVPRDLHLGDEEFDQLKVGERIRVEIQKSRFQLRDPFIVSVGVYRGRAGAPTRVMPQIATTTQAQPQLQTQAQPQASVAPSAAQAQAAIPEEAEEEGAEEEGGEEKEEE